MKISISIEIDEPNVLSGFELGDMYIVGKKDKSFSSLPECGRKMMVFVSVPFLLDGIKPLLSNNNGREFIFFGIESSFNIIFKQKGNVILVKSMGKLIEQTTKEQLFCDMKLSIQTIINEYNNRFKDDNPVFCDIIDSFYSFCNCPSLFQGVGQTPENQESEEGKEQKPDDRSRL